MDTVDEEILDAIRKRRLLKELRADAIACLRGRAERNVSAAVGNFLVALVVWLIQFSIRRTISPDDWQPSEWSEMIGVLVPIVFIWQGYRCLVPDPRDRFLLLLAKEALLKGDEPVRMPPEDPGDRSSG